MSEHRKEKLLRYQVNVITAHNPINYDEAKARTVAYRKDVRLNCIIYIFDLKHNVMLEYDCGWVRNVMNEHDFPL